MQPATQTNKASRETKHTAGSRTINITRQHKTTPTHPDDACECNGWYYKIWKKVNDLVLKEL